jgi:hexosaminidase
MIKAFLIFIWGISASLFASSQQIIPLPVHVEQGPGNFIITGNTTITAPAQMASEAKLLQSELQQLTGKKLRISKKASTDAIILSINKNAGGIDSYSLLVTDKKATITAGTPAGVLYGIVSLLQLLPANEIENKILLKPARIPALSITDSARFKWRGLMLDLSRTFMPPDYIKRTIRRMAFYKLNVLHLHLTDDQGWRIPIKSYPLLVSKASMFDSSFHEPKEFQGYYTEKDIRELHLYAAAMHVQLVPEIESPGHSHAALFAYPSLSCSGDISPIYPLFSGSSISHDVFCAGNPASIDFFKTVITETTELFPSEYIHLGGDEVPRDEWQKCPKCQRLVKSAELESTSALQGYFMKKLGDHAVKKGKRPVAWDEILHDNSFLTKDWVIMSWTGSKPGLNAAAKGFDVVMTPTSHMYFDYTYNDINTKKVFEFDPLDGNTSDSIARHVLGIQANYWSHIDRTQSRIDSQLYPRLLGLAERAWSSAQNKNYENFRIRKAFHRNWLNYMDVKYFHGDFE